MNRPDEPGNPFTITSLSDDETAAKTLRLTTDAPRITPTMMEASVVAEHAQLAQFVTHMQIAKRSPETIQKRLELINRLGRFLAPLSLLEATPADIMRFQATFAHRAPATVNIYTRHIRAFYQWAYGLRIIDADPSAAVPVPQVRKGLPHPTNIDDLRTVFACTLGGLRLAYVLAAFAGLRRGEICRLQSQFIDLNSDAPSAWVFGKGGKERRVPLLAPVVAELSRGERRGYVVRLPNGRPYSPNRMSVESSNHLAGLGIPTTLHSMRHFFGTEALRDSKDILMVRDILGHESVATTEIYTKSDTTGMHGRLDGLSAMANGLLRSNLRIVRG